MGKSEHVSFIGKLNSHLIKKQFKERRKSGNEGKQNESSEKEEKKEKKHFWWKWLSFFRGHSARRGGGQRDAKSKTELVVQEKVSVHSSAVVVAKMSRDVGTSNEGLDQIEVERGEEGVTSAEESVKNGEKLFTCAASVCEDPDNLIEIAVTLGQNQPSENGEPTSEDIKRIKINEKSKRSTDAEESSDSCLRTLKTVSEPSWNEKFKILQQQELKQGAADLVQQFMILESEVDIDCSECSSKETESKHKSLFDKGSPSKDTLREVSPEVLVNIRPFKMFMSERYLTEVSSCGGHGRCRLHSDNECQLKKKRLSKKMEMSSTAHEHRGSPRLSFKKFSVINELDRAEGSICSLADGTAFQRMWEMRTDSTYCRECREDVSGESDGTLPQYGPRVPTLSVLGFCDGESQDGDSKRESIGKWNAEETGDVPRPKNTVDELLDSLDDSNHDVIFQKNISQFRKKIGSPHVDLKKPAIRNRKRKEKFVWKENIPEESVRSFDWRDAQSDSRFGSLESQRRQGKTEKAFSTSLMLSEGKTVARTLGVRTEWGTIRVPQTVEVLYTLGNEPVIFGETDAVGDAPNKVLYSMKAYEAIAALYTLGFCGGHCGGTPARNFPETFRLLPDKTKCYYLLPEQLFFEIMQKNASEQSEPNATKMPSRSFLETLGAMGKSEGDGEMELKFVPRKKNMKFTQSWAPHRVIVQMMFCSSSDYAAVICDRTSLPGVPARIRSEPNVPNKNEPKAKPPCSATRMPTPRKKTDREAERTTEKAVESDIRLDGVQVIYSNSRESLLDDDDEDDIAKAVFSGSKHDFLFFPVKRGTGEEPVRRCPACAQLRLPESGSRGLRFKSNSSPAEHVRHTEFCMAEQRARRSFNLSREIEKEVECFRKKRSSLGAEDHFRSLLFPKDLKYLLEKECKGLEGRKPAPEKSGTNLRKEMTAAFNTIKEINSCKGEHRGGNGRMSLVIMLSKK